jgi:hypothetical protein
MKALELLETYPKAGKVVNDWFLDKMLKSLNTDAIPEEFKEYISNQPIDQTRGVVPSIAGLAPTLTICYS